ncbi:MAG: hypothetical protein ABIF11_00775 [Nitrospirota bacterium]
MSETYSINKPLKLRYKTKKGECLYSEPGDNGPKDLRLYIGYDDRKPWAHTLELIGACLRAKGSIEDWNYPKGEGRKYLLRFIWDCIMSKTPISELLKRYKIKDRFNGNKSFEFLEFKDD